MAISTATATYSLTAPCPSPHPSLTVSTLYSRERPYPHHATPVAVPIRSIYFTTAPLDWGLSFNFLSYNGQVTLCCTSDDSKVAQPQAIVDSATACLAELIDTSV